MLVITVYVLGTYQTRTSGQPYRIDGTDCEKEILNINFPLLL